MLDDLKADLRRYRSRGLSRWAIATNPAVWALVWYRLGYALYHSKSPKLLLLPLKILHFPGRLFCEAVMQTVLDPQTTIGPGLLMVHIGGIHLHPLAVIGAHCDLSQNVTIGTSAMGRQGAPVIGDGVYIGTGATVVGKIKIGNGAKIAANTLVISNVPEGATVMGVPGRIVMRGPNSKAARPAPVQAGVEG